MTDEEKALRSWKPRTYFPIPESEYRIPKTVEAYRSISGSPSYPACTERDREIVARAEYNLAVSLECKEHLKLIFAFHLRQLKGDFAKRNRQ